MEKTPQQNKPSKMAENAEPKEIAGVPAAQANITEQPASNNNASQSIDEATSGESGVALSLVKAAEPVVENMENASETNNNKDQKVADWNRFAADPVGYQSREVRTASGSKPNQNQQSSNTAGTVNWKKRALTAEKQVKGLRGELSQEKENSKKIKKGLDSALKDNDLLAEELSDAIQEISLLDPESQKIQQHSMEDLESKVASLEAEIRDLRSGAVVPNGQASGNKSETSAIQQLEDNMGIDSDEEIDDFESDEEDSEWPNETADSKAEKANIHHEDEPAEDEDWLKL